jgi:radical SAM superfamily enzyme YgiQ (UPF0313 family)
MQTINIYKHKLIDIAEKTEKDREELGAYIRSKFKNQVVKRVLLVNPPDIHESIFDYSTAKRGRANNYPPYGLGVIAGHLIKNNYETQLVNLNHEILKEVHKSNSSIDFNYTNVWKKSLQEAIDKFKPDLVGVTCLFSVTGPSLKEVCDEIKNYTKYINNEAGTPVAVGGVHLTHDVQHILDENKSIDFAFLNESEIAFIEFLNYINNKKNNISHLANLITKSPINGEKIIFTKQLQPNENQLEMIPAYELMDIENHSTMGTMGSWYGFKYETAKIATALSNRGCRAACTFCNVRSFNGKGVRQRSVDSVLDELELLKNKYGIGHIIWLDDDLLMNEKRAISLFNGMVDRKLNMTWDATNGVIAASLNDEVVEAALRSGCIGLNLGIESGNAEILKSIQKPGTPRIFRRAAEVLRKYPSINTKALLIIGFPKETMGKIFDTIKLCEEMNLDWHNIAILQPWKNTPIYDAMVDQGLLGETEGVLKGGEDAPYQLGPYSRQRAIEQGKIQQSQYGEKLGPSSKTFLNSDNFENLDYVPNAEELDEIWFYMNFRLNFSRLLKENRPEKLNQQLIWLKYVHEKTAPDNAIILYFYAYIQSKLNNKISTEVIINLKARLEQSEYWREKFLTYGLKLCHVEQNTFPRELIFRIPIKSRYAESEIV